MSKSNSFTDTVDKIVTDGVKKGILHLNTQDIKLLGNVITLKQNAIVNFGSCSYLGLEFDRRMIDGAKDALENYGTEFSCSRAYVSSIHYEELEKSFQKIFNAPSIVTPTTTLGHMAAIPVIVADNDAVILDHHVHNSVRIAVNLLKPRGIHVELLRHNRLDILEKRVRTLRQKHQRIWYMVDDIYSMYGDFSPINEVHELMNTYSELYYYVDGAHGMSCYGKYGQGYALSKKPMHEQMIFAASLAKGFASGGAVLVFPNKELARRVRTCGGPLITSGPMQPAALGAAIASAKIHLSSEIHSLQSDLHEKIKFTNLMLKKYNLPLVAETDSPIFFVDVGLPKLGYNMVRRMLNEGYYINLGIFPAVPIKNTGLRFTITRLHTCKQIESMIAAMAYHLPLAMVEEGISSYQIYKTFKMEIPEEIIVDDISCSSRNQKKLIIEHYSSIVEVNKNDWNTLLGDRGAFNWEGLKFIENNFSKNELPEDNWTFDYLIIKDSSGKVVLATFLTSAVWKDDMLSSSVVSSKVEEKRKNKGTYYLTSKVLMLGSLLTEGNHLYLDKTSQAWRSAMIILLEKITEFQKNYHITTTVLRDMDAHDDEMDSFLIDNGFFKIALHENHCIEKLGWTTKEEYLNGLSLNSKRHIKRNILESEDKYEVEIFEHSSYTTKIPKDKTTHAQILNSEIEYWYKLYLNVKRKSFEINTFTLPIKLFQNIALDKNWEIIILKLKPEFDQRPERKPVAVLMSYIAENNYNPMIIGLDYQFQEDYKCYRQALYQGILRANVLKLNKIYFGVTASIEKQILGAKIIQHAAYMQIKGNNYNMEELEVMNALSLA